MSDETLAQKADLAAVLAAYDELVARVEDALARIEAELPAARAGGDWQRIFRTERGITWYRELLDLLGEEPLQKLMDIRHNVGQLSVARDGEMV